MLFSLRREGSQRWILVLAALVFGLGALIAATGATAGPATSTTTPFAFGAPNPCTGEVFAGSGHLHLLISSNLSASGNVQTRIEANFSGLQAVTATGKKYVVADQENYILTFDSDGAPVHETVEFTLHFMRSGEGGTLFPDDDFYVHSLTHVTANANGDVTAEGMEVNSTCK